MESVEHESEDRSPSLGSDSYNGTRGDSGSSASHDAAVADAENGVTNRLQWTILTAAYDRRYRGITAAEAREYTQEHHGRVSSAMTKLHIAGHLVALEQRRGHGGIYVAPEFVDGRAVRPYKRQGKVVDTEAVAGVLMQHHSSLFDCSCGWKPSDGDVSWVYHVAREISAALS